uniref:Uncharacterized protein n=1 Tax=Timema shepardi TaxID=629360 RepID=A0A7R9ARC0_TIMSH|nr:unnamed protein product [Timema shepardi]
MGVDPPPSFTPHEVGDGTLYKTCRVVLRARDPNERSGRDNWPKTVGERETPDTRAHRAQTRPKNIELSAWRGSRRPWWVCKPRPTELTMLDLVSA